MRKCIMIPDSFKGTLTAAEICDIMKRSVHRLFPECEVHAIPVADGGEGTVDCFLYALGAQKIEVETTGPYNEPLCAYYARMGETAVIETASAAGLPLVEGRLNPRKTTTYGLGTLIRHAVEHGCRQIMLGLGGSCTNDGGVGMARALGMRFYDESGREFAPDADELVRITKIDPSQTNELLKGIEIKAMCDIDNPLCGPSGASFVFGPQKGADEETVQILDQNLRALSGVIETSLGICAADVLGAGAAGGLGAGCVAFLKGTLKSGIEAVLELVDFDRLLDGADLVFTGEGRIDSQSLRGKVILGVAGHAKRKNVPVVAVVGAVGDGAEEMYSHGVSSIFSINRSPMAFEEARGYSSVNLEKTMDSILRFYQTITRCHDYILTTPAEKSILFCDKTVRNGE